MSFENHTMAYCNFAHLLYKEENNLVAKKVLTHTPHSYKHVQKMFIQLYFIERYLGNL